MIISINYLYIDPGAGSMIFTLILGISATSFYAMRLVFTKIKYRILGGKVDISNEKIPFVIFAESKTYFNVFNPICRELDALNKKILYLTGSNDDPMLNNNYNNIVVEVIENQNKMFAKLNNIRARILLSTTPSLNVYQWKKSKDVDYYVHIIHSAIDVVTYKMFGLDYYDAVLLNAEYQINDIRELEKIRKLPRKDLKVVGIPYLDEMKKKADSFFNEQKTNNDDISILLAPTWDSEGILSKYGEKLIDALVSTGYKIIIRPHPQSYISESKLIDRLYDKYKNCSNVKWNKDIDNFDVLNKADIMISDYSGVIYDFVLVFNKPIIYTSTNLMLNKCDAWWLNRPIWTESALPRLGLELTQEKFSQIKETIDYLLESVNCIVGRKEVKREVWEEEGKGAINVKNYLEEKYNDLITAKQTLYS